MSIIEKIIGNLNDKRAWRDYKRRVAALPKEYNIVMNEMQSYIWNCGSLEISPDGNIYLLYDLLDLMEASVADGKQVLDVTGNDVAEFCDELIREWRGQSWRSKLREKCNERIMSRLGSNGDDGS